MATSTVKYLIIGNSAGGIGAAEAIRQVDKQGALTIVSEESYPAYSRPLISEYLAQRCPLERMLFRPADFYDRNHIRTFLGKRVERVKLAERLVELDSGDKISWEKLLLATGGVPIVPQMKGIELSGVFSFTTLDDAKAIDHFLNQLASRPVRAVVIGGGLIGVSATEALVKRGAEVTVVEMQERILSTILDKETSALEEKALKQAGVAILTSHTVAKVTSYSPDDVTGVSLDDGRALPCELVVIAIGVRPRTELVSDSGIKINRGILVDRQMATSSPDVYACGDVAEAYDFVYQENRLTPIWPNAYLGGRSAGLNMAGVPAEYAGGTAMNSLKYFGLDVVAAGMVSPPDDSYEILSQKQGDTYHKIVLKDGLIVGMIFAGNIEQSGIVFHLMKDGVKVDGFKHALVADDFGLVSLPEEIWRPHLAAPSSRLTPAPTIAQQLEEMIVGE